MSGRSDAIPGARTRQPTTDRPQIDRLKRAAAIASVTVAALLIGAKAAAYVWTGSVAMLSTLIDSFLDFAASFLNLVAIRQAAQPADREHRFGHGKAEPLAGLGQAAFIGGSALFLVVEAGGRLFNPAQISNEHIGIAVMLFSIGLTTVLVLFQRYVIKKTGSVAIGADSLHYKSDLLVNVGVIAALLLASQFGWTRADPIFALGISGYILWSAAQIVRSSLHMLMDHELPEADRERIRTIALSHPEVRSVHDLRTRSSGTQTFIQLHLELDGDRTLFDAHAISDEVMAEIERAFPNAEVLIHEDPYGVSERRTDLE